MKITVSFHGRKDKDIIEYIQGHSRTYKIKEAIRKAIQFDNWIEKILSKGFNLEESKNTTIAVKAAKEPTMKTSKEIPQLSEEEINEKLNNKF